MNNPNSADPARDPELGPMIGSLFLPKRAKWAAIDFATGTTHLVQYAYVYGKSKAHAEGVEEFVHGYRNNPDMDFHTMVAEMAQIPRKQAKTINLGLMYGMGVGKMSDQLDITLDEARLGPSVSHTVPFVKMLMTGVQNRLNDGK